MKTKRNLFREMIYCAAVIGLLLSNAGATENDLSIYGDALTAYITNPGREINRVEGVGSKDYSIYSAYVIEIEDLNVWGEYINSLVK